MRNIDLFDAKAFGISHPEAVSMDPQHRLILGMSSKVLASSKSDVEVAKAGVFVGISWTEYSSLSNRLGSPPNAYTAQGAVLSVCPGRVSYHFGLKGPSVAMDTACSSSLVALSMARTNISPVLTGAIVSGINMILKAETTNMFKKATIAISAVVPVRN